ncbi:hypothetical protein ACFR9U_16010 [Halorientalis brevis]|uniref:DUF6788 domain-containing protein n=1 Tax=Halorientalis brevis TaxID=1126241 RepID=A0ABD6CGP0_9EURY|nr:hypothetical protein [Halorientalis brevis]
MAQEADIHYDPDGCLAIVGSTGTQCGNGDAPLCGTHEKARSVRRVDEFESGPNEDLRDDLVEKCDIQGEIAYALATIAPRVRPLWRRLTALEPIEVGGETWDPRRLLLYAEDVADHPEHDRDHHLFANADCIAVVEDGQYGDEYRCVTSGHGNLLCGVHNDADDLRTVLDEDYPEGPNVDPVWIDGEKHWLIERRGDDTLVVTPDFELTRLSDPDMLTAEGLPIDANGWRYRSDDGEQFHEGFGRIERVRTHEVDAGVEIIATNSDYRAVIDTTAEEDVVDTLAEFLLDNDPEDVEEILEGNRPEAIVDRLEYSERPDLLSDVDGTDVIAVSAGGNVYQGIVTDIGTGAWDTPADNVNLRIFAHDVEHDSQEGMLTIQSHRDAHDQWSAIQAEFSAGPDAETVEVGTVDAVESGDTVDPTDLTAVEENNQDMSDEPVEPDAPSSLPKYLREGAQKQDAQTLRDLAEYAAALADHREAQAEHELEEQAVDEDVPEEWDEDEWAEQIDEARENADIEGSKGTLTTKQIDGRGYYYLQWREGGKIKSQYVAPETPSDG